MLKRPKFLKILIIAYITFTIVSFIQLKSSVNSSPNDIIECVNQITTIYIKLPFIVIMITLFFGLLALEIWGYFLQIFIGFLFIIASLTILSGNSTIISTIFSTDMPKTAHIFWLLFNCYVMTYFFRPKIYKIFVLSAFKKQVHNSDLYELINFTNSLANSNKTGDKLPKLEHNAAVPAVSYLPNARVLLAEPKNSSQKAHLDELNILLKHKAKKIIKLLSEMLPSLNSCNIIDSYEYDYFRAFSWNIDEIITYFKELAIDKCQDNRDITDKIFKYSKKVEEVELLEKTNQLMQSWIEDTGKEIGSMLDLKISYGTMS